jgi:hypothetical protein
MEQGWRAVEGHYHETGEVYTLASKSGPECYADPSPLMRFHGTCPVITRLDICCEVEGLPVGPTMPMMFAGQRRRHRAYRESDNGRTCYVGSPQGPRLLRVYEKESDDHRLVSEWASHGWTGGDLTRIEYQLKRKAVERAWSFGQLPIGDEWQWMLEKLWRDSLARLRLCKEPPSHYFYSCDAPTDKRWLQLGEPVKAPAARVTLPGGPDPALIEQSLERAFARGLSWNSLEDVIKRLAPMYARRKVK